MPFWLDMFLLFASLSLVAVGGANVLAPEMHRQLVDIRHLMGRNRSRKFLRYAEYFNFKNDQESTSTPS